MNRNVCTLHVYSCKMAPGGSRLSGVTEHICLKACCSSNVSQVRYSD